MSIDLTNKDKFLSRLKAKFFLALIFINWGSMIIVALPLMVVSFIVDKVIKSLWLYSLLLAQDHYTHTIMGGHFLTTISAILGHMRLSGSLTGAMMADVVDYLFELATGETNHCVNAIEKDDILIFNPKRAIAGTLLYWLGYSLPIVLAIYLTGGFDA